MTPPLEEDTEITGPLAAQLWVSSTTEDMDLFLTLRNIDPAGNDVLEIGQQGPNPTFRVYELGVDGTTKVARDFVMYGVIVREKKES